MEETIKDSNPQNSSVFVERNEKGQFVEGHKKLGGATIGSKSFTTKVKDALEKIAESEDGQEITFEQQFIQTILHKAIVERDSSIIKLVWNYLSGMPQVSIEHSGKLQPGLSEEQKQKLDQLLLKNKQDD